MSDMARQATDGVRPEGCAEGASGFDPDVAEYEATVTREASQLFLAAQPSQPFQDLAIRLCAPNTRRGCLKLSPPSAPADCECSSVWTLAVSSGLRASENCHAGSRART